ncbi:MAG TPA: aldehyde dehydrogenase family protein [Fimbriimonadaceae bacterium]|nr:aldehyde dehydrogenase family protein [Fimbriimonadaceae bacterium]
MTTAPLGALWPQSSLIWGRRSGTGNAFTVDSPLGHVVQSGNAIAPHELFDLANPYPQSISPVSVADIRSLGERLGRSIPSFVEALHSETAFVLEDCEEITFGVVEYLRTFAYQPPADFSYSTRERQISLRYTNYGTVAAILPQNAFLSMAAVTLASALATGNRVILRAPTGSPRTLGLLSSLVEESEIPGHLVSLVFCEAEPFLDAMLNSSTPMLIHYMGSSNRAGTVLTKCFEAGKSSLVDGSGNCQVYVHADQDPIEAADLVWKGAIRYNGQTCTSVNGIVVHPDIAEAFADALIERALATEFGTDNGNVGPLFSSRQALQLEEVVQSSGGEVFRNGKLVGNRFPPTVILAPDPTSDLVTLGAFGPVAWLVAGDLADFRRAWSLNRYPLCAGIFAADSEVLGEFAGLESGARLVLNGDPSLEDANEPWGGYAPCGSNPVSDWPSKYCRKVQLDQPLS